MEVVVDHGEILFATEKGYGKKVRIEDFRIAHRGGLGVRTIPTDKRNGIVIGLAIVHPESNILLIDQAGKMIRLSATDIRAMGRQAKGVRLIRLDEDQKLHNIAAFEGDVSQEGQEGDDESSPTPKATMRADDHTDFLDESGFGDPENNAYGDEGLLAPGADRNDDDEMMLF